MVISPEHVVGSKGKYPTSIIYSTTPAENISALVSYYFLLRISGAVYPGVPHLLLYKSESNLQAKPKSIILISISLFLSISIKLSNLISLCTIYLECK